MKIEKTTHELKKIKVKVNLLINTVGFCMMRIFSQKKNIRY